MDFSLKKSFKSNGSYKHVMRNIVTPGANNDSRHEELPILADHDDHHHSHHLHQTPMISDRKEVIVKIDQPEPIPDGPRSPALRGGNTNTSRTRRESSYDFWKDEDIVANDTDDFKFQQPGPGAQDPPSRLISQFLNKQRETGNTTPLDIDLEMDELRQDQTHLPPLEESPSNMDRSSKDLRVSFQETPSNVHEVAADSVRRRFKDSPSDLEFQQENCNAGGTGEVLRCTSSTTFQTKSILLRAKTKSRLMDPPEEPDNLRSGRVPPKSGQLKSGLLGKTGAADDEDDDPFLEDDLPYEYKRSKCDALTLLEWLSLIIIIGSLICTLCIPYFRNKSILKLKFWRWEVLVLVLICGRLVSGWGIRIIVFFIERNFLLRKRVLYFVYGLRNAVQNCLWLGLVLIAWHLLFDKRVGKEANTNLEKVTKVLVCFLVGTLVWLVKTLIVKVLASSFHVSKYFDRIQESLFNQYVIETLSGPPLVQIRKNEEAEARLAEEVRKLQKAGITIPADLRATAFNVDKSGRVIGSARRTPAGKSGKLSLSSSGKIDEGITIDHLHKLNPKNVSAWNMKRLMNMVRRGTLSTLDEQIQDSTHEDDSATEIKSEKEAKAAAKKIFQNVASRGSRYIYPEDLLNFMREDEALKTMSLFEGTAVTQKISKSSLKNWVVNAFRERRALALTLNDTKTAVNKLHHIINFIVSIIILVIWLLILGIATSKYLLFVSSQLVLVAFIFGNSCKTVFEAIIFLFVIHPFDVGDRCEIDGVQMVVEEMNILTTVFLRYDNLKVIYPNSVLAVKPINNYYRSPDMGEAVEFLVHLSTPADKIALMRQRIISYIENKKEHWYPSPMLIFKDVDDLNRIKFAIWPTHRINHQDMGERWVRRALLVEEMTKIFRELDIQYRLLARDINIVSMPPLITSERMPPIIE